MTETRKDPLDVRADEFGTVRLFVADPETELGKNLKAENVGEVLGGLALQSHKVEVVSSRAVEGLGLAGYLHEGYGVAKADLADKKDHLNAATGILVFIPASAFDDKPVRIEPDPSLGLIGLFQEERAAPPKQMSRPDGAKGQLGAQPCNNFSGEPGRKVPAWIIVLIAFFLAAALFIMLGT